MIALLVLLSVGACTIDDAPCWRALTLEQSERADRAEQRVLLERSARSIVELMVRDESQRADRWRETANQVAQKIPTLLESPYFWMGVGLFLGVGATVGVAYALKPVLLSR